MRGPGRRGRAAPAAPARERAAQGKARAPRLVGFARVPARSRESVLRLPSRRTTRPPFPFPDGRRPSLQREVAGRGGRPLPGATLGHEEAPRFPRETAFPAKLATSSGCARHRREPRTRPATRPSRSREPEGAESPTLFRIASEYKRSSMNLAYSSGFNSYLFHVDTRQDAFFSESAASTALRLCGLRRRRPSRACEYLRDVEEHELNGRDPGVPFP